MTDKTFTSIGNITPISELIHGRAYTGRLRMSERRHRIRMAHLRGKKPDAIAPDLPIGADDPVERYPDGENAD